jgi:hypothetical protein
MLSSQHNQLHEDELLAEVEVAVKKIEDDSKAVTFRAVGEIVGMAPENFKYYPRVRIFLEQNNNYLQFRRRSTLLRENE